MDDDRYEVIYRCVLCGARQIHCVIKIPDLQKTLEQNLALSLRDYNKYESKVPLSYHVCCSKDEIPSQVGRLEFAGLRKEILG